MHFISYKRKLTNFLISFLQLQLFLTLISWPILIYWGLPLSIMSPIGNLLFSPVITIYLLISSLLFFSELLHIPNGFLVFILEKLTYWWIKAMNCSSSGWLIGVPSVSIIFLIFLPIIATFFAHYKGWRGPLHRILAFLLLIICTGSILYLARIAQPVILEIACARAQKINYYSVKKKALLIGPTGLQQRAVDDWVEYNLLPELIKKSGSSIIDYLVISAPKKTTFELAAELIRRELIKKIYIQTWDHLAEDSVLRAYGRMKGVLAGNRVQINYFKKNLKLDMGNNYQLHVVDGKGNLSKEERPFADA